MALLTKIGYGQVEPNHLSAQRTGQIYAQLPANTGIDTLENGQFIKYKPQYGVCDFTGQGEYMLVYNEIKLYDKAKQGYKDFALKKTDSVDGKIYPRLFKTNVGDIFTTNLFDIGSQNWADVTVDTGFIIGNRGILTIAEPTDYTDGTMIWLLVKKTTMPDGQAAGKFMRLPDGIYE